VGIVPFIIDGSNKSVVTRRSDFSPDKQAVLIISFDQSQFVEQQCNATYDLRVGDKFRDHREPGAQALPEGGLINLFPGNAVIIQTEEEIQMPNRLFGYIQPRVSLLEKGIANTPSKVDPGYPGHLLVTTFNHGKRRVRLRRGERFCSLYLVTVEDGIIPFEGPGKQLPGMVYRNRFQRIRDWVEARQIWLTVISVISTAVLGIVAVISLVISLRSK
jgi:deoxycytidine triphosphate deaminase